MEEVHDKTDFQNYLRQNQSKNATGLENLQKPEIVQLLTQLISVLMPKMG